MKFSAFIYETTFMGIGLMNYLSVHITELRIFML